MADSKAELGNHICSGTKIVWENVLRKGVGDNKFIGVIEDLAKGYEKRFGRCLSYEIIGNYIRFSYEKTTVVAKMYVADDKITGFWIDEIEFKNDSFKKIGEDLDRLPGKVSVSVVNDNGTKLFSFNDDIPLSVASSFKLFVLKALKDKINDCDLKWDDIVFLEGNQRSYPSGVMQNWLADTPVTVKTLATLMISISDNTAADVLIDLLGRAEVEKHAPRNKPFLKAKEFFMLENENYGIFLKKYLKSTHKTKLKMLDEISFKKMPPIETYLEKEPVKDIGWFATTSELCDTVFALKDEPIITINPGILDDHKKWSFIGYKGGSSFGVRQFTQVLKSKGDNWYCISTTWNNREEVDEGTFSELLKRMAVLLPK